jgi:effector-binding domain-containing protein
MYKLLTLVTIILLIASCGGPKKETPNKPATITTTPTFEATTKIVGAMTVASIAKKGPYNDVGKTIGELMTWVMTKKIIPKGNPFGVYYDEPGKVPPESMRYEVCLPVSKEIKSDNVIKVKDLPEMEVVSTIYMGPYDKVGPTYGQLMTWVTEKGYVISGPAREIYMSNSSSTPTESLKTEIQFPIKKKTQ